MKLSCFLSQDASEFTADPRDKKKKAPSFSARPGRDSGQRCNTPTGAQDLCLKDSASLPVTWTFPVCPAPLPFLIAVICCPPFRVFGKRQPFIHSVWVYHRHKGLCFRLTAVVSPLGGLLPLWPGCNGSSRFASICFWQPWGCAFKSQDTQDRSFAQLSQTRVAVPAVCWSRRYFPRGSSAASKSCWRWGSPIGPPPSSLLIYKKMNIRSEYCLTTTAI